MVLGRGIAGKYLIPRIRSYYYPVDHTMYVDLYGALPMQIPIITVDLAAAKSRNSMHRQYHFQSCESSSYPSFCAYSFSRTFPLFLCSRPRGCRSGSAVEGGGTCYSL